MKTKVHRVVLFAAIVALITACGKIEPQYHDFTIIPGAEHLAFDFWIDEPNISAGSIGHFNLSIRPSIKADTEVSNDVLDLFSVVVRETGRSWDRVAWIDTNEIASGVFPKNYTMSFKHRIFTDKNQQSPQGIAGPYGFGVLVDNKGLYNLDLKYGDRVLATREFRIK